MLYLMLKLFIFLLFFTFHFSLFTLPVPTYATDLTPTCTGDQCTSAGGESCANNGVKTGLGCVSTQPKDLIALGVRFASGIGGGIALLIMIAGSFKMMTSAGNIEKLREGRSQFSSAAIGLVFIIMAVVLLQILGVDILNLPGFTR
jgi:hypothetical protein